MLDRWIAASLVAAALWAAPALAVPSTTVNMFGQIATPARTTGQP